ncbi:MAG: NAD(P)/FAD-dependent oxidoreductase [Halobacteriaceae archaeon]
MPPNVVVLGAGYAGAGTVQGLEDRLDAADITWISDTDHHLVLHEAHRVVRDPNVRDRITVPVHEIKDPSTTFVQGTVTGLDTADHTVELEDGTTVDYDYVVVCIGSDTAFFGIEGLAEHSHTLKSLDDALGIHDAVMDAVAAATPDDRAHVVVGGAGLSGIQTAGEIAELRDRHDAPIDISLVEGLDTVFPPGDPELQGKLRKFLEAAGVDILTGEFIGEVDEDTVYVGEDTELDYDTLVWTGGITGRSATTDADVEKDERDRRLHAGSDFQTSDDRVFAVGDAAHVEQGDEEEAPPTAQAAWQAAEVVAENVERAIEGRPLRTWTYDDHGTLISVGDRAIAHDVEVPPGVELPIETFGGTPAELLKKAAAARWIARVTSYDRALRAWSAL